jgi:hypothetical protein
VKRNAPFPYLVGMLVNYSRQKAENFDSIFNLVFILFSENTGQKGVFNSTNVLEDKFLSDVSIAHYC